MSRRRRLLMRWVRALKRKRRRRPRATIYRHAEVYFDGVLWLGAVVEVLEERSAGDVDPPPL